MCQPELLIPQQSSFQENGHNSQRQVFVNVTVSFAEWVAFDGNWFWMSRSHALGHMQKAHCVLFGFIAIWPVSPFANAAPAKWNYCQFWLSVLLLAVDCVHKLNASSTMHIKFDCINFIVHQSAILHCRIPIKLYMAGVDLNNNTTNAQFLHFSRKIGWTVCVTRPGEQLCCAVECLMCPSIDLHVFHTNAT